MASTNINISERAYQRLKNLKAAGQSFSDVILEHVFPPPCATAGELLDHFRENSPLPTNQELMRMVMKGRGRKSNRRR